MLLLALLVLLIASVCGYDLVEYRKIHLRNIGHDGYVLKQNQCTEEDYNFFDRKFE